MMTPPTPKGSTPTDSPAICGSCRHEKHDGELSLPHGGNPGRHARGAVLPEPPMPQPRALALGGSNHPSEAMTLQDLSRRRREVAILVGLNYSCQEIATELEMSIHTVHSHVQWIAGKIPKKPGVPAMRLVRGWVISKQRQESKAA